MNPVVLQKHSQILFLQRNILLFLLLVLLVCVFILSVCLLLKSSKTVIVPASLSREVMLENGSAFSDEYLEEMSMFFAHLLFDLNAFNVVHNSHILLRHVDSDSYHVLSEYFKVEEQKCKKYNLVTKYNIQKIRILEGGKGVELEGILESRFANDFVQRSNAKFVLEYGNIAGRLVIIGFIAKEQVVER